MLGEAGLIEPSGRQVASLSADDMIRTSQQKHRCVPGGGSSSGLGSNHHSITKYFQALAGGK